MPRRLRKWELGGVYHITHRCHEKNFLLKFSKYRDMYLDFLYEASKKYRLKILDYAITSNHVHLMIYVTRGAQISRALQCAHGRIAQKYNTMKGREGAFWKDRYHATRIQDGEHFGRCLFYIDMNMVRAGVVDSPLDWGHNGCCEFFYEKERRRIVDMKYLLQCLWQNDIEKFRKWYIKTLREKLRDASHEREGFWSNSLAVGKKEWLEQVAVKSSLKQYKVCDFDSGLIRTSFLAGKN